MLSIHMYTMNIQYFLIKMPDVLFVVRVNSKCVDVSGKYHMILQPVISGTGTIQSSSSHFPIPAVDK